MEFGAGRSLCGEVFVGYQEAFVGSVYCDGRYLHKVDTFELRSFVLQGCGEEAYQSAVLCA
mgnify:CR=1 FL=1